MATDLTVYLKDEPGTIAEMGLKLGAMGINILGGCGFGCEGRGEIHILVEDIQGAKDVLSAAGFELGPERDVVLVTLQDVPGSLGAKTKKLADAGVNIDLLYIATSSIAPSKG